MPRALRDELRRRRWLWGVAVGLGAAVVAGALAALPLVQTIEWKTLDARFRWAAGARKPSPDIALVAIYQSDIGYFKRQKQRWPWPRTFYAALTDYLARGGARAVVFDVLFSEPDAERQETSSDESDGEFARAVHASGRVFLATHLLGPGETDQDNDEGLAPRLGWPSLPPPAGLPVAAGALMPIARLQEGALGVGFVNLIEDHDDVCRRLPLFRALGGGLVPQLAYAAFAATRGQRSLAPAEAGLPVLADGTTFLMEWYGRPGPGARDGEGRTFPYFHFASLLRSQQQLLEGRRPDVAPETFKDKIVIVGSLASGLHDVRNTPLGSADDPFPGMEIHATLLSNLLARDFVRPLPALPAFALALGLAVLVAVLFFVLPRPGLSLPLIGLLLAAVVAGAFLVFRATLLWVPVVAPLAGGVLALIGAAIVSYQAEGRARQQIRAVFSRYVAPEVVQEILADPTRVGLGGKEIEATVFFSDVKDFTTISESLPPTVLVDQLNHYLDRATNILIAGKALIDKYIGDAIMAVFGAPLPTDAHARDACLAALHVQEDGARLREEARAAGRPALVTRIGLHSGRLVVGNVGSHLRLSYTAMGDTVNLASRLEGVNKEYGTLIIISEATYERAREAVVARELDFIRVKGKAVPTRIFELVGRVGRLTAAEETVVERFAAGLVAYRARRWDEAEAAFRGVLAVAPADGPAEVFLRRVAALRQAEPPVDWDGVYTFEHK